MKAFVKNSQKQSSPGQYPYNALGKKKKLKFSFVFEMFIFSPPFHLCAAKSLSISKSVVTNRVRYHDIEIS